MTPRTQTALLLMDLQLSIVERLAVDGAQLVRTSEVASAARAAGAMVVHVVAAFRPGHPEVSAANRRFVAIRDTGALQSGDPGTAIHPSVEVRPEDILVTKKRVSAFVGSDLDLVLRARDVSSLVLAGVSTSGVVLSTLRAAADMDYGVTVLEDCCADPDPEVHRLLVQRVFPVQAEVVNADQWQRSLSARCDPGSSEWK